MSRTSAVLIAVAALVGGCGGGKSKGSDEQQVRTAVTDYAHAFGGGDGSKACKLLTAGARDEFLTRVSALVGTRDCAQAVEKLQAAAGGTITGAFQDAKVTAVRINGDRGTATLVAAGHPASVPVVKQDGDWLLAHVPGT